MTDLANLLGKTRDVEDERWIYRFANGLVVETDPFMRRDRARVLPIGGPQDMMLNRLVHKPEIVRGKRILDAFAGSGILGLMALKLGAAHVDFVDINPRAVEFQRRNCARNGFGAECFDTILGSVADFACARPCDVILANPPFVPTPPGIEGTLTSRAGPEGNDFVRMLLARIDELLAPDGEACVFVLQLVLNGAPLIARELADMIQCRPVQFTPVQIEETPIEHYVAAYLERFPEHDAQVREWDGALRRRHGTGLCLQHYVMRILPRGPDQTAWSIADNLSAEFMAGAAYPASGQRDMALGRVAENFILP